MPTAGVRVLLIGSKLELPYDIERLGKVNDLFGAIARFRPDVIVTSTFMPGELMKSAFDLRKRWVHLPETFTVEQACAAVEGCYSFNIWHEHQNQKYNRLVSVYTGTYNTGDFLRDTFESLRTQTYPNWEWVVVDDHSTDGTWERLEQIASEDVRVHPHRLGYRHGKIGAVKDAATRLCNGEYLVELDHDDMLTDNALAEIRAAFDADPEVGMVYSNSANFFQDGSPHRFNDSFWKDRYREIEYRGKKYLECLNPNIYDRFGPHFTQQFGWWLTVGPNHVRAYRAEALKDIGGYTRGLPVADDWDVFCRVFCSGTGKETVESTTIK